MIGNKDFSSQYNDFWYISIVYFHNTAFYNLFVFCVKALKPKLQLMALVVINLLKYLYIFCNTKQLAILILNFEQDCNSWISFSSSSAASFRLIKTPGTTYNEYIIQMIKFPRDILLWWVRAEISLANPCQKGSDTNQSEYEHFNFQKTSRQYI